MNDHKTLKRIYKRAKQAYKADKSNEILKRAKYEAKNALMNEHAGRAGTADGGGDKVSVSSSQTPTISSSSQFNDENSAANETLVENGCAINTSGDTEEEEGDSYDNSKINSTGINELEKIYQTALASFKSNKSDKELRRAKTAARRALDAAILAAASSSATVETRQQPCLDCSKTFIYSMPGTKQQKHHKRKGQKDNSSDNMLPKRCQSCHTIRINRLASTENRGRTILDSQKRNMCYAFQKGECTHGENCKFSHNPEYGGGKLPKKQPGDGNSNIGLQQAQPTTK